MEHVLSELSTMTRPCWVALHSTAHSFIKLNQWTGSKLGEEYVRTVYCHPAYLTYMHLKLCEMPGWMKLKLESGLLGEISITSNMQMISPYGKKQRGTKEPLNEDERGE